MKEEYIIVDGKVSCNILGESLTIGGLHANTIHEKIANVARGKEVELIIKFKEER